jgi:hypothetical protein
MKQKKTRPTGYEFHSPFFSNVRVIGLVNPNERLVGELLLRLFGNKQPYPELVRRRTTKTLLSSVFPKNDIRDVIH